MGISLSVGNKNYEIGTFSFLKCFISTIIIHLENSNQESRFPIVINKFYTGEVSYEDINEFEHEVKTIQEELTNYKPQQVIWDKDNLKLQSPWGNNISSNINDLSDYFITSDGKNLFDVLLNAIQHAKRYKRSIIII